MRIVHDLTEKYHAEIVIQGKKIREAELVLNLAAHASLPETQRAIRAFNDWIANFLGPLIKGLP